MNFTCSFQIVLVLFALINCSLNFNVDVVHPLVYEDPQAGQSYFGYSVQFLFTKYNATPKKWILVGSPKANSTYPRHRNLAEPGRVYQCGLGSSATDECLQLVIEDKAEERKNDTDHFYIERKDFAWLGGAVAVNNPYNGRVAICSHRWANKFYPGHYLMNGACYWSEHDTPLREDFQKTIPLIDSRLQGDVTFNYAYGQAGLSVHMAKRPGTDVEEMLIGAPGVYNWTGTVIRINDANSKFDNTFVANTAKIAKLQPNDYFGYSIHSGMFFRDRKLFYVSGAPRAANLKGKVFVYELMPSTGSLEIRIEKDGAQLGEYFGASVLAVDLNDDLLDDLLVGAPQFCIFPDQPGRSSDEGKVYVFINKGNGLLEERESLLGNQIRGSRFGTTIAKIGKLNADQYNDIVVGAPYENDRGAVYIYFGGQNGFEMHPTNRYWQRIAASDFPFPLKGFGISIAAADIDNNQYPDLVVGSYLSNKAVVLRSNPIIQFEMKIETNPSKIIPTSLKTIQLQTCSKFLSKTEVPAEICVLYTLNVDLYVSNPRVTLLQDNRIVQAPLKYRLIQKKGQSICRNFSMILSDSINAFSQPVTLRLTADLLNNSISNLPDDCKPLSTQQTGSKAVFIQKRNRNQRSTDSYCSNCPVLDNKGSNYVEVVIPFSNGCTFPQICYADLDVRAHFTSDEILVIGSKKTIKLKITVSNYKDTAEMVAVDIKVPSQITLRQVIYGSRDCRLITISQTTTTYSCSLAKTLQLNTATSIIIEFDTSEKIESGTSFLTFTIDVSTTTQIFPESTFSRKINLQLPLKTEIDVWLTGNAIREHQYYQPGNETFLGSVQVPFKHRYEVTNVRSSPLSLIDIDLLVPINISTSIGITTLVQIISIEATRDDQPILCNGTFNGEQRDPTPETRQFHQTEDPSQPTTTILDSILQFNCSNNQISCLTVTCQTGDVFSNSTKVVVTLTANFLYRNIVGLAQGRDTFLVSTSALVRILEPEGVQQPVGHRPDNATVSTSFIQAGKVGEVAAWVIATSALAGIILLSLLIVALVKCGFFKRKRYQDMLRENSGREAVATDPAAEQSEEDMQQLAQSEETN